jgi:hypothetical protein
LRNQQQNDFSLSTSARIFYDERMSAMAELFDIQKEELTASAGRKIAIGVVLTLFFHLADALLGSRIANNFKIRPAAIGKVKNDRQSTSTESFT